MDIIDISNYTSPLTPEQQIFANERTAVVIGIQDSVKARAFQQQLTIVPKQYYIDLPRRDWTIFPWYSQTKVWLDIEIGCYTRVQDVDMDLLLLDNIGCRAGIYCNKESLKVLDGSPNPNWGNRPLWYADYGPARNPYSPTHLPTLDNYTPFSPWNEGQIPEMWQYSSAGVNGINCDLNIELVLPLPPFEDYVTHFTQYFASGKIWEIDAVPPPGR